MWSNSTSLQALASPAHRARYSRTVGGSGVFAELYGTGVIISAAARASAIGGMAGLLRLAKPSTGWDTSPMEQRTKLRLVDGPTVRRLLPMDACIDLMRHAFR